MRARLGLGIGLVLLLLALFAGYLLRPSRRAPEARPYSVIKVALVLPGPIDDRSWSQSGHEGLMLIQHELGAQVAYRASVPPGEAEALIRAYAKEGFDFIILHGAQYIPAGERVAKEYPRTHFAVVTSYPGNNVNLGALSFRAGEVGYLTGVVAALKTRTKHVAYLGGERYPITLEDVTLFKKGVEATDASVRVSVEWVNSWSDAAKARRIAMDLVRRGADVLVVNAALASRGALEVAEAQGVHAIGWNLDRYDEAPHAIVTSAIQRVPVLLLKGATLVQAGRWEGRQYKFGLREGAQELAPFRGTLTPEQEAQVRRITQQIETEELEVTPTASDRRRPEGS